MSDDRGKGPQIDPLEQELEKLRAGFADRLPMRLQGMEDEWRALQDQDTGAISGLKGDTYD